MDFELTDRHLLLRQKVREFAAKEISPLAREMDRKQEFPVELFQRLAQLGYAGCGVPYQYKGTFSDYISVVIIGEEMARISASVPVALFPHAILCAHNIFLFADEEQKQRYLPGLAQGKKWGAMALAEPGAGSDILSLTTKARKSGTDYILKGSKTYITNVPFAHVYLVFARTDQEKGPKGISAFIVEKRFDGFRVGRTFDKMGMRGSPTGRIHFKDCVVPGDNLLGRKEGTVYEQFYKGMDVERISWASIALGICRASFEKALDYAKKRKQFGKRIIDFQMIQHRISEMAVNLESARLLTYQAANLMDKGRRARFEASAAKLLASEAAVQVSGDAVQIYGGAGYMKGAAVERYYRDAKVLTVAAGSSEVQRMIMVHELRKRAKEIR
jgi:isovaleryl-CoA dehydrogenase